MVFIDQRDLAQARREDIFLVNHGLPMSDALDAADAAGPSQNDVASQHISAQDNAMQDAEPVARFLSFFSVHDPRTMVQNLYS